MAEAELKIRTFGELTAGELYEIVRSRCEIFLLEQKIICMDFDGKDRESLHAFLDDGERVVAYLRAYRAEGGEVMIGRVLSLYHGIGLGTRLITEALPEIYRHFGTDRVSLHAQCHARGFYERLGFSASGEEFSEEGIAHIMMSAERK